MGMLLSRKRRGALETESSVAEKTDEVLEIPEVEGQIEENEGDELDELDYFELRKVAKSLKIDTRKFKTHESLLEEVRKVQEES